MYTSYRYKSDQFLYQDEVLYFNWESNHGWVGDPPGQPLSALPWVWPSHSWDKPPWADPNIQDCHLSKWTLCQFLDHSISTPDPGNSHIDVWIFPGRFARVPTKYIMAQASSGVFRNGKPEGSMVPDSSELYAGYLPKPHTSSITLQKSPFESEFSVWYSVVDLFQVPRLVRSLLLAKTLLKKIQRQGLFKTQSAAQVSNSYLAVQFGLLPTLNDMRELLRFIVTWGDRYSDKNKRFGAEFTAHAPKTVLRQKYSVGQYALAHVALTDFPISMSCDVSSNLLYATLKYQFICPELTGFLNRLKQFTDSLGLLDPAAAWDVIPFSFLVDWIYPVGQWLHGFKPALFPADVAITDFCESIGQTTRFRAHSSWLAPDPNGPDVPIPMNLQIWEGVLKQYARKRFFPVTLQYSKAKSFTANNSVISIRRFFIGTSLAIQQANNRIGRKWKLPLDV